MNIGDENLDSRQIDLLRTWNVRIVQLDAPQRQVAALVRRFLAHAPFRTWSGRRGKVIRYSQRVIRFWEFKVQEEHRESW